jgi:uncharacterized protein (DUF433 family)
MWRTFSTCRVRTWADTLESTYCIHSTFGSTIKRVMAKEYIEERDGNYYVADTRISLDSIVHAFRRGDSPETICQNFELLRLEEIYGAIAYYLANLADIDAYLIRQNEKWAEGRSNAEPLPDNLRERLTRARDELHTTGLS